VVAAGIFPILALLNDPAMETAEQSGKPQRFEFTGELYRGLRGVCCVDFPFDAMQAFGTRRRVKVRAWVDGHLMRKSLLPKGDGTLWLSVSLDVRAAIGKGDGDSVTVILEKDCDPRIVPLPEDLEWLLDNEPLLKDIFQSQSWTTQHFFIGWLDQTRDPEKRVSRINRIFDWLRCRSTGRKALPLPGDNGE